MNEPKNNAGTIDDTGQQLGNYRLLCSLDLDRYGGVYLKERSCSEHVGSPSI